MNPCAVTPAFEGAFTSSNSCSSVLAGPSQLTAGPDGVIVGRFGWADPVTGQVSNARTDASQVQGFVLPQWGTWNRIYCENGTWILRQGLMVTLANRGDFGARFAGGAYPGNAVWANTTDGSALAYPAEQDPGAGFEATSWSVVSPTPPGGLASISPWQTFSPN